MNILLFFVLPIATIIFAVVLQKLLRCPTLVALTFFAIYLILAYTVFDTTFLIFVIIYTILSFIAAYLAQIFLFNGSHCYKGERMYAEDLNPNVNNIDGMFAPDLSVERNYRTQKNNKRCYGRR